jgi:hypothetical protein
MVARAALPDEQEYVLDTEILFELPFQPSAISLRLKQSRIAPDVRWRRGAVGARCRCILMEDIGDHGPTMVVRDR